MADKKWSEFDLLKSIKGKNIELLTIIEDNTSFPKYDNKRVKLSDILDPINLDITNIKLQIQNILTEGLDLTTIGIDPPYWYANEDDPENKQLVELSIAKDLKREIDSTVTKIETLENEVVDIKTNIEEIVGDVLINKTNIEVLGDLVDIIKNNYYNKNDILNEVLPDIDDKAPSSEAVFNFVDLTKNNIEYNINNEVLQINNTIEDKSLENKNYTDIEIQKILNKITNLEFDSFYFDNNAKDGEFCVDYDIESVVINKSTQKIFVVEDNKLYKELSLNRPEVLEIANEVVDLHRDHVVKYFDDDEGLYKFYGSDQHSAYNGKYVGKTNYPSFVYSDVTPFVFLVSEVTDSYLFSSNPGSLTSDFYAIIDPYETKCLLDYDGEIQEGTFLKCVKSEYWNLFTSPFIVRCEFLSDDRRLKFNIRYYSYFKDFKKLENLAGIFKSNVKELQFDTCKDFYLSNTSEVFNDYKQTVPTEYDYFHSVNNLNNKFLESTTINVEFYPITYLDTNDLECVYALECKSSNVDLLDYVGYYIKLKASKRVNVVLSNGTETTSQVDDAFGDMTDPLNMNYRIYLILLGVNQNGKKCPIITRSVELEDGIYNSITTRYFNMSEIERNSKLIAKGYLKIEYDGAELIPHGLSSDSYSDLIYENTPSFIMGENNLWHLGEFILGDNNIPTHSIFTIAHKKYNVYNPYNHEIGQELFNRDNIFEVDQNGLIFIKSSKELSRWYEDLDGLFTKKPEDKDANGNVIRTNNEVLNLEYRCLQRILIDLMEKIDNLDWSISNESKYALTLENRIANIERELNIS